METRSFGTKDEPGFCADFSSVVTKWYCDVMSGQSLLFPYKSLRSLIFFLSLFCYWLGGLKGKYNCCKSKMNLGMSAIKCMFHLYNFHVSFAVNFAKRQKSKMLLVYLQRWSIGVWTKVGESDFASFSD